MLFAFALLAAVLTRIDDLAEADGERGGVAFQQCPRNAVTAMQKVLIVSFAAWILRLVWPARSEEATALRHEASCR